MLGDVFNGIRTGARKRHAVNRLDLERSQRAIKRAVREVAG